MSTSNGNSDKPKKKRSKKKNPSPPKDEETNQVEEQEEAIKDPSAELTFTIMRRFNVIRAEDPSGMSGVGIVGEGVQFTDGSCAYKFTSTEFRIRSYADNIHQVEALHSHLFKDPTWIEWIDPKPGRIEKDEEE